MIEYTWTQLRYMAGIDSGDDPFVQDIKLSGWLGPCKYRIITAGDWDRARTQASDDGIEVLIIKE